MCDTSNLTNNLTSKLVNRMQPPNSITVSRVDTTTGKLLKPLVMLQPLPLGPFGFLEKLWPSYTNMNTPNEQEASQQCMLHLDNKAVIYNSSRAADYNRYALDDTVFKKRHIQDINRHIIIPTDALQTRSMICLIYEGGLYHKTQTGSDNVLRWFMLLPSSRSPELYPIEIQLQPNGVLAIIRTQYIHDSGYWSISFEEPEILAKYIATYTEHVVEALERTRAQHIAGGNAFPMDTAKYTAKQIVTPGRLQTRFPLVGTDALTVSTNKTPANDFNTWLKKTFGM